MSCVRACKQALKYLFVIIHSCLGSVPGSLVESEPVNFKYVINRLVVIFTLVLFYTCQNIRKLAFLPVFKFLSCNPYFEASFLFLCEKRGWVWPTLYRLVVPSKKV